MATPLTGTPYKISILFNQGLFGWSETYYFSSSTDFLPDVSNAAKYLASQRIPLSITGTYIAGIRVSLMNPPSRMFPVAGKSVANPGQPTGLAEYPSKAWLCSLLNDNGDYRRKIYLRGMHVAANTYNLDAQVSPTPTPAYAQKWALFTNVLAGNDPSTLQLGRWGIRGWAKETPPQVVHPVTSVSRDTTLGTVRYGMPTAILVPGSYFRARKIKGPSTQGANGSGKVIYTKPDPDNPGNMLVTTNRTFVCPGVPLVLEIGEFAQSEYRLYGIQRAELQRIVTKRVGRAFFGVVGARKKKKC